LDGTTKKKIIPREGPITRSNKSTRLSSRGKNARGKREGLGAKRRIRTQGKQKKNLTERGDGNPRKNPMEPVRIVSLKVHPGIPGAGHGKNKILRLTNVSSAADDPGSRY